MGIASLIFKYAKAVPRYAFGHGYSVISKARKTAGKGYTIFQQPVTKTKAGWNAMLQDVQATANKPGIFSKAKSAWNVGVSRANISSNNPLTRTQKFTAGLRGIGSAVKNTVKRTYANGAAAATQGKYLGKLGKFGEVVGGVKNVLRPLGKMPVIASLMMLGCETPDIVAAYKDGGFLAGTGQVLKSASKIIGGTIVGALGTVVGGPIGGMAGYVLGESLVGSVLGPSYTEAHPTEDPNEELSQAQQNGILDDADTQAQRDQFRADNADQAQNADQNSAQNAQDAQDSQDGQAGQADPSSQTPAANNSQLPDRLVPSDTAAVASNPFAQPTTPVQNAFGLNSTSNIFQRYPMGFTFQYQGSSLGMMQ